MTRNPKPSDIWDRRFGVLRNAYSHGSASTVGNASHSPAGPGRPWPQASYASPGASLYDVRPHTFAARVISLEGEADTAMCTTVVFSHRDPSHPTPMVATRETAAAIDFGTGNASHHVEVDIAHGSTVTIPAQTMEVTLLDYSLPKDGPDAVPYWRIYAQGSAQYLAGTTPACKTMRAYLPAFVPRKGGGDGKPTPPGKTRGLSPGLAQALQKALLGTTKSILGSGGGGG